MKAASIISNDVPVMDISQWVSNFDTNPLLGLNKSLEIAHRERDFIDAFAPLASAIFLPDDDAWDNCNCNDLYEFLLSDDNMASTMRQDLIMNATVELFEVGGWQPLEWYIYFQVDGVLPTAYGWFDVMPVTTDDGFALICFLTPYEDIQSDMNCSEVKDYIATLNADVYVVNKVMVPDEFQTYVASTLSDR